MFCNECGSKLSAGDKVCRTCGLPADQGEACGGFWGLTGMKPPVSGPVPTPQPGPKPVPQPGPKPGPRPVPQPAPQRSTKPALPIWQIACGVLLVLLLIQSFRIDGLKRRLEAQTDDYCDICYEELYPEAYQAPVTTAPESTAPETTAPETIVPETTLPQDTTAPEDSTFGTDADTGISDESTVPEEDSAYSQTEESDVRN